MSVSCSKVKYLKKSVFDYYKIWHRHLNSIADFCNALTPPLAPFGAVTHGAFMMYPNDLDDALTLFCSVTKRLTFVVLI